MPDSVAVAEPVRIAAPEKLHPDEAVETNQIVGTGGSRSLEELERSSTSSEKTEAQPSTPVRVKKAPSADKIPKSSASMGMRRDDDLEAVSTEDVIMDETPLIESRRHGTMIDLSSYQVKLKGMDEEDEDDKGDEDLNDTSGSKNNTKNNAAAAAGSIDIFVDPPKLEEGPVAAVTSASDSKEEGGEVDPEAIQASFVDSDDDEVKVADDSSSEGKVVKKSKSNLAEIILTTMAAQKFLKKKQRVVDKLHSQFEQTLAIMIGIRDVVKRYQHEEEFVLTEKDFFGWEKKKFKPQGSADTPKHQLPKFEFKDYSGRMFAELRRRCGISDEEFVASLAGNLPYIDFLTNSKSGQFFFFSQNRKFMIKTMPQSESKFLRSFLRKYYNHVTNYPDTLLCKLYGMYRLELKGKKTHFIVMGNMFPSDKQIHLKFDLKGSTVGRAATELEKRALSPVLKDLDFEEVYLDVGAKRNALLRQIELDTRLLAELNIMDYSMLVGIHFVNKRNDTSKPYSHPKKYISATPAEDLSDKQLIEAARALGNASPRPPGSELQRMDSKIDYDDVEPGLLNADGSICSEHGMDNGQETKTVYYLGIIDILQRYVSFLFFPFCFLFFLVLFVPPLFSHAPHFHFSPFPRTSARKPNMLSNLHDTRQMKSLL